MSRPIRVGITHGEINGVGYEVILKALAEEGMTDICTPVLFGYYSVAEKCRKQLGLEDMKIQRASSASAAPDGKISVVEVGREAPEITPGNPTPETGASAVAALEMAVNALQDGAVDVLVTAPICKENRLRDLIFRVIPNFFKIESA
ncbi:MAG: 4-hydroxythreonine-4-phosphate dehydrogenase PdxA, partial [Muribaculaceae bacterium]|nr:4-hydroxythreonine-4-phosphate dehydrogenase PdxA [Muribaculaceae bacterium]